MKFSTAVQIIAVRAVLTDTYLYNATVQTKYGPVKSIPALNATCCSYLSGYESVTVWKGIPFAATTGG